MKLLPKRLLLLLLFVLLLLLILLLLDCIVLETIESDTPRAKLLFDIGLGRDKDFVGSDCSLRRFPTLLLGGSMKFMEPTLDLEECVLRLLFLVVVEEAAAMATLELSSLLLLP